MQKKQKYRPTEIINVYSLGHVCHFFVKTLNASSYWMNVAARSLGLIVTENVDLCVAIKLKLYRYAKWLSICS